MNHCLSVFHLLQQNTINWVIYKNGNFLAVLEAGKSKIRVLVGMVSDEGVFPDTYMIVGMSESLAVFLIS